MSKLTIHERDISPKLCQSCAACCRIKLPVSNTDSRYRMFLRTTGFNVLPPPTTVGGDCCDGDHDIKIDMGYCPHLRLDVDADVKRYSCTIHGTEKLPKLCKEYNCVSWAKTKNSYNERNEILVTANAALKRVNAAGERADE
jgi:hypothetical protein